jgi:zinc resistance-associated protein
MKASFRASLTAFAASTFVIASLAGAAAQSENPPGSPPPWMEHWEAEHAALLDAKLAGLKAGLRLTPDQEKFWGPFEAAVRDAAQMREQHMMSRMERMHGMAVQGMGEEEGAPGSPIDRLEAMADRLSQAGAAIKKVADAGQPLYASLDDTQKRIFAMLGREMMMLGHGHGHGMMGWGHHPEWGPTHEWGSHRWGEDSNEDENENEDE